jgi:Kef-type K+ transport system membrane component KefB/mannitol/fructose-specific phosphotransferase system IIA component (Ntr-type)
LISLALPITNPVLIFALAMLIFVSAPLLFERLRLPGIIGLIAAGAIVGPNGLELLARDATIVLLGTVGLLYLMFIAGVEIDLYEFARHRNRSLIFGAITNLLPQFLGTGLGLVLGYGWAASILLGSMLASHTLLAYPVASRLGIAKNEAVVTTVGGTIITDSAALLVLAVVAASLGGSLNPGFWLRLAAALALFVAVVMLGLPRLGHWFFRNVRGGATLEFVFILAALFTCAYLAEAAGVEPIIGAFLAGLALNRLVPEQGPLMNRLQFFGNAFFIPFFLLSIGMLVDVRVLAGNTRAWEVMIGMTTMVVLTKWLAAKITQRLFGYSPEEGWLIFGLSVPQAAATLAATLVGYRIGLFDDAVLNGAILMILVTCIAGPWTVEKYGRRVVLREERKPYEPARAPQRILIPMANPATAEDLLALAILIRDAEFHEPIHPLTVVPGEGDEAEAQVALAERMLGHAVIYAAGAEVPVVPLTRVDHNFATGIARGIAETRSSVVIIGWDGRASPRNRIFGTVLDQLLEQTRQLVLVAKLGHPLNTTQRLVLVIPPGADHHPGFFGAVRITRVMASRLGASLHALVVNDDPELYRSHFAAIRPVVPTTFERSAGWDALLGWLGAHLRADDLVLVLSARRGGLAWSRELERLPVHLASLGPESFITVYPSEADLVAPRGASATALPRGLTPERIVFGLPPMPFRYALQALLRTEFADDLQRLHDIADTLEQSQREFSTEIRPGVVVPHARVEGLTEPMLFLGISPDGITFPMARERANLVFLLLSPPAHPEEHLKHLGEIARLAGSAEHVQTLAGSRTLDDLYHWFGENHG